MLKKKSLCVFIEEEIEFKSAYFRNILYKRHSQESLLYFVGSLFFFFLEKQEIYISKTDCKNCIKREDQIEFDITLKESHWFLLVSWLVGWLVGTTKFSDKLYFVISECFAKHVILCSAYSRSIGVLELLMTFHAGAAGADDKCCIHIRSQVALDRCSQIQ